VILDAESRRSGDTKFGHAFDDVFRTEGIKVIRTPVQAPNANAYAERWARTLRADCLDRILILGRRHLEHVLKVYRRHLTNTGHTARSTSDRRTAATNTAECERSATSPRAPRRTQPRIRSRLSL
jgi:hypothetical protein